MEPSSADPKHAEYVSARPDLLLLQAEASGDDDLLIFHPAFQHIERSLVPALRFDPRTVPDDRFRRLFRFSKEEIPRLVDALRLPAVIITRERCRVNAEEALCILLRRLAFPSRLLDLREFGRSEAALSGIFLHLVRDLANRFADILHFDADRLRAQLPRFAGAIARRAPLDKCWGFIDGTVRPTARPSHHQHEFFNGHKWYHGFKFHIIATPDGLISHLFGPVEGRRHDMLLVHESGLHGLLQSEGFRDYFIYGDPAYRGSPQILSPFRGAALTPAQRKFNASMSAVRVSVEWAFGLVVNQFQALQFKYNMKILLNPVASIYSVAVLLTNCRTCLRGGNSIAFAFNLAPPSLQEYLHL